MIALALPTNRGLRPKTLQSLLLLAARTKVHAVIGTEGFTTAENRTWITARAIKEGATHLFWVDDDMIYPEDTLEKLLRHDKDIVGAKYHNRRGGENGGEVVEYFEYLEKSDTELFRVKALGGGCVLIKADVFKKIPQPWFGYKTLPSGAVTMSHDWYFCEKAREAGYEIWCDPTIKVGHIGIKKF